MGAGSDVGDVDLGQGRGVGQDVVLPTEVGWQAGSPGWKQKGNGDMVQERVVVLGMWGTSIQDVSIS